MGLLIFAGLVAVAVVVIGFAMYGALLGLAMLAHECKRLFWPELPEAAEARIRVQVGSALAVAKGGEQRCRDIRKCLAGQKECCPSLKHPALPCWLASMRASDGYKLKPECVACSQFSLPAILN